ncbi:MAG TPA: hypothetical protein VFS94_01200 [Gemmatimonadales bacterium]|nr:hypothetical protein [Gemmatimonadales bacterium]
MSLSHTVRMEAAVSALAVQRPRTQRRAVARRSDGGPQSFSSRSSPRVPVSPSRTTT